MVGKSIRDSPLRGKTGLPRLKMTREPPNVTLRAWLENYASQYWVLIIRTAWVGVSH